MRLVRQVLPLLLLSSWLLLAQNWEVGADAGYGTYRNVDVTGSSIRGSTGFERGVAFGAVLGNDVFEHIGGEIRYTYQADDLRVTSGGTAAQLGGQSHALHYDVLIHATRRSARVRPFVAVGAGAKIYRGTGAEPMYQPLSNLVVLTHVTEAVPLISAGAGIKFALPHHALLRLDFRDYMTPVPTNLLALPGSRLSGWLHDFVFLVGVSKTF